MCSRSTYVLIGNVVEAFGCSCLLVGRTWLVLCIIWVLTRTPMAKETSIRATPNFESMALTVVTQAPGSLALHYNDGQAEVLI